jgi:hypothetical protein
MASEIDAPKGDQRKREALIGEVLDCADRIQLEFSSALIRKRELESAVANMEDALREIRRYLHSK